jgi:death-on-curing family protein
MNKISIEEFIELLAKTQQSQSSHDEPIPTLAPSRLNQVASCLETPFQTGYGTALYKGFVKKAAILFYLIIKNHPLENGNKRMAVVCLLYFFSINHKRCSITAEEMYNLAKFVAQSADMTSALFILETIISKSMKPSPR